MKRKVEEVHIFRVETDGTCFALAESGRMVRVTIKPSRLDLLRDSEGDVEVLAQVLAEELAERSN